MPKYLVETVSMFRMRYVVEAKNADHAKDEVTMNYGGELLEFSQLHLDEVISSAREIDRAEFLRLFDEDNEYLKSWDESQKFNCVNVIDYDESDPLAVELDPDLREWEYDGTGIKVWKGTRETYDKQ